MSPNLTRRGFIRATAALATAGLGVAGGAGHASESHWGESAEHARLRAEAIRRRRRIIYNNDGCDVFFAGANTREGFLAQRFNHALNTQVDSIFYCTGESTMFSHLAPVGETYGEFVTDESGAMAVHARDNIRALKQAGLDTLQMAVDFCHGNNIEIFFSHRINDIHDTLTDWLLCRWKREHPEYLLGTRETSARAGGGDSPRHWWTALDFEKPEVLDYLIAIQEDVCRRYEIDGVEIDYFRSPMFFRPNLDFEPATEAQVQILTQFQRRLRELTVRIGSERGRPILMATRVPATVGTCRHVGIDISAWLRDGLTDLLPIGGGYVPFTEPIEEMVQLGHTHGVPVYPTISASGMRGREKRYGTIEAWRGAASNAWRAGVDGIYIFNLFPAGPDERFQQLGSPDTLAGRDKLFVVDNARILEGDLVQGIEQSQALPLPLPLDGSLLRVALPVGDDFGDTAPASLALRVQITPPDLSGQLRVMLNGTPCQAVPGEREGGWVTFHLATELFAAGANTLDFAVPRGLTTAGQEPEVLATELEIRY